VGSNIGDVWEIHGRTRPATASQLIFFAATSTNFPQYANIPDHLATDLMRMPARPSLGRLRKFKL